jgi:hypothetical protein
VTSLTGELRYDEMEEREVISGATAENAGLASDIRHNSRSVEQQ